MKDSGEQMSKACSCPYCDAEIAREALPWCQTCGVEVLYCPKCHEVIGRDDRVCPHCGASIEEEAARGEG